MTMNLVSLKEVRRAVDQQIRVIRGHLDLEGFAYIKITRTGAETCCASDDTAEILKDKGMDYAKQAKVLWKNPVANKYSSFRDEASI